MSETTVLPGFGVTLQRGDSTSPEQFVDIAEITDVSGPGLSRDALEATHTASPNRWREFIAGLKDGGEISLSMNHLPLNATQNADSGGLVGEFATTDGDSVSNWRLVFPTSPVVNWTFPAIVTAFEPSPQVQDIMTASATFKIAGEPTLA